MGLKAGWTAHLVDAPDGVPESMGLPDLHLVPLHGEVDYLHLFVTTQERMREELPHLVLHLAPQGKLWVSWPKGRGLGSDLTLPTVIEIGYDCGLVESTCLSIDATWSALRFTRPKPGVVYRNSFGTLPDQH
ncbi:DUF3052 family protein [Aeromicrobium flavum]